MTKISTEAEIAMMEADIESVLIMTEELVIIIKITDIGTNQKLNISD
jgi:hypothetical protein